MIMSSVPGGYLGSSAVYVPDLEESQVGVYQDTVLHLIDALLVKLLAADIKIIISMHDRFALGCYSEDSYAIISNITIGSSGNATCGDATSFYNTSIVIQAFDARIKHILSFKSEHFGGASWGSLGQVIYAFSIQNYAQFTDTSIQPTWWCDRAKAMRPLLSNGVKISTGPSNLATDTITDINMACGELDILSVSIYFLYASDVVDIFKAVNGSNKMVINEEFDSDGFGYKDRDGCINLVGGTSNNVSISWLVGNVFAMPGDRQGTEFSWSTDEKAWAALTAQAKNATGAAT